MSYPGQGGHHYQQQQGFPNPGQGYNPPGYGPPPGGGGHGGYGPPQGPPPPMNQHGGYAPPQGPPPPGSYGGYAPSNPQHHHHQGGYGPPPGPPPRQGGYSSPSGPPPQQHTYGQTRYRDGPPQGPIGPPEYATSNVNYNPQGGMMNNNMRYEYSNMSGKRKALLIGINYHGRDGELQGCINDAINVKHFLLTRGYKEEDMVVLTDDQRDRRSIPTRANITAAMNWLVRGAQPGDALFLHYSGHGGQAPATGPDEADGMNETICPLDYEEEGMMEDDELHAIMVRPLPVGCRLTALFDSCHSGTVLDLPYVYSTSGTIKDGNIVSTVGKGLLGAAMDYARGDVGGMLKDIFSTAMTAKRTNSADEYTRLHRSSGADVISLSGCKDAQTSADTVEAGKATGACSYAFLEVMNKYPQLTYKQMLNAVRDVLAGEYDQKPQLSASHPIDVDLLFVV